jgi:predicted PurR-regulated permease PerM
MFSWRRSGIRRGPKSEEGDSFMKKEQIVSGFFIGLLVLIVFQSCLIFAPFFQPIFWASILAFMFYPVHEMFLRWCGGRKNLAAFVTSLGVVCLVTPFVMVVVFTMSEQLIELVQSLLRFVEEGSLKAALERLRELPLIQAMESNVFKLKFLENSLRDWLIKYSNLMGDYVVEQIGAATKNLALFSLGALLTIALVFVFLRDGRSIYRYFYDIAPLDKAAKKAVFGQITETFAAVIRGQILTALAQAVVAGIIFHLLSLPLAIVGAALTFLASLLPIGGVAIVWVPITVSLCVLGEYGRAVALFFFGIFVISLIDNFLKPALIGERTKLPYFLLFLGILGGVQIYGIAGIFLAPIIISLFFTVTKIYREKYLS